MLRDKNLIPLSHQHQHALALCVRIDRATDEQLGAFQREIGEIWASEMSWHFRAEEQVLFPAADKLGTLSGVVAELLSEHGVLREYVERAQRSAMNAAAIRNFSSTLSAHIRKEERQLFEECQRLMTNEQLGDVGTEMQKLLSEAPGQSCSLRENRP